ncbi:hypothetical protein AMTRI_Chr11g98970 [Amborella trichopoda]|uniref:Rapid ALkalinization Factor n=1 Tax=Amborella trichopoda TaxID=13333 RepID=W1PLP2_AMBTC|nr:protein RALF-like 34 [Amborella trichopoda]ERN08659.1 hypothetical protein AMTR_s00017p00211590 [Amborella trichopoda]|eukprot:XP_011624355.1 protein RALF-like 34 [Amborella trichopoda]
MARVIGLAMFVSMTLLILLSFELDAQAEAEVSSMGSSMDALEWGLSSYNGDEMSSGFDEVGEEGEWARRSLYWRIVHYYISYGALSANRIPCPPRSGRSYYTHNCYKARGPVRPYHRGCNAITGCSRDVS